MGTELEDESQPKKQISNNDLMRDPPDVTPKKESQYIAILRI
jgi:hypothetical protein